MKRKSFWSSAVAATATTTFICADAVPRAREKPATTQQKMASVDYLIGDWSCDHTVGNFAGKYKTTYTKVLGNLWLRETYDFLRTSSQAAPSRQLRGKPSSDTTKGARRGTTESSGVMVGAVGIENCIQFHKS